MRRPLALAALLVLPGCDKNGSVTVPTLVATCEARPVSGRAPLAVSFLLGVTGAQGAFAVTIAYGDGADSTNPDAPHTYAATLTIDYGPPFLLGQHASGQVADQFDGATSKTGAELVRFKLTNSTGVDVTVDQIAVQLSAVSGITAANLTSLRLNDGSGDLGGAGTPAIAGATGTIVFDGNFTILSGQTKNYSVYGDVAALANGDTMTLALGTGDITLVAGQVAVLPGVLWRSFDRFRTSSPRDVLRSPSQVRVPRYRGMVGRWHGHLHGLATASRARRELTGRLVCAGTHVPLYDSLRI